MSIKSVDVGVSRKTRLCWVGRPLSRLECATTYLYAADQDEDRCASKLLDITS